MRLASYNVENLFDRAKVLSSGEWSDARALLDAYTEVTKVLQQQDYSASDKTTILRLLETLGLKASDETPLFLLRQNRGQLLRRSAGGKVTVVANGRGDWIGWLEMKRATVTDLAVRHTAQVVHDVGADVLGVVEAEDRWALRHFNADQLTPLGGRIYGHVMLIDGNDERGIDVGLMTRGNLPIGPITSHVDDSDLAGPIFSRDCAEFEIALPDGAHPRRHGQPLQVEGVRRAVGHREAQAAGPAVARDLRAAAGRRLRARRDRRRPQRHARNAALSPLLRSGGTGVASKRSDLRDVSAFADFDDLGRPGTYGTAAKGNKIDYILCSPALFETITAAGVHRAGVWTASGKWEMYPTLKREQDAASDHAAIWVDLDL